MRHVAPLLLATLLTAPALAAPAPVSEAELKASVEKLVSFGTRHSLSDTTSETRGIGAARRWAAARFAADFKGLWRLPDR